MDHTEQWGDPFAEAGSEGCGDETNDLPVVADVCVDGNIDGDSDAYLYENPKYLSNTIDVARADDLMCANAERPWDPPVDLTDAALTSLDAVPAGTQWHGVQQADLLAPHDSDSSSDHNVEGGPLYYHHQQPDRLYLPTPSQASIMPTPETQQWTHAPVPWLHEPVEQHGSGAPSLDPSVGNEASSLLLVVSGAVAKLPPSPRANATIPPVPPQPNKIPAPVPLNTHGLFVSANFRGEWPNERGRGAFAAAVLSLLEKLEVAPTHVQVVRASKAGDSANQEQQFDRWSLNRLPGYTDVLLHFINNVFTDIVGLKPFKCWRSLARCLGDSRSYLSHRHWQCLELKGGGKMASTVHPWQSYRTTAGHFDSLANELVEWLSWCHTQPEQANGGHGPEASKLAKHRSKLLGDGAPRCDCAKAMHDLLKLAWESTASVQSNPVPARLGAAKISPSTSKRKGSTEANQIARPTKKGLLVAAALVVGTCATVLYRGDHLGFTSDSEDFHGPSGTSSPMDSVVATGFIEVGTIDAVGIGIRHSRTVSFQGSFVDPVIIGGIPSINLGQFEQATHSRGNGAVTRIRGWSLEQKTFEIFLDVPNLDGQPCSGLGFVPEIVSWMVVEAGTWQSTNQVHAASGGNSNDAAVAIRRGAIEAGSGLYGLCAGGPLCSVANGCNSCDSTQRFGYRRVDFVIPHPDPVVLTQVQTHHGHNWVTQRLMRIDPSGFHIRQESDGEHSATMSELLGWVVFSNGAGWFDVRSQRMLDYQAIRTDQSITSDPYTIPFEGEFSGLPALFGSLQKVEGHHPSHLRYILTESVDVCTVFVENYRCNSPPLALSAGERAGIVAIEPGLAKLKPQSNPLGTSLRGLLEAGSTIAPRVFDPDGRRARWVFQTASAQFTNPVVFLGALKHHESGSDRQNEARVQLVHTIPAGVQCPDDDADGFLAAAGFSCQQAEALVGCSVDHYAFFGIENLLAKMCPRTCNACGTTIVTFVIDSPLGLSYNHASEEAVSDPGVCTQSRSTDGPHLGYTVPWLVTEAGVWAGSNFASNGKLHVASSTFGICTGGPLCTPEHGCNSCHWSERLTSTRVQFEEPTFSEEPLVLSQLQTAVGLNWATLRLQDINQGGFRVQMQGNGVTGIHVTEKIGYLALPTGIGILHGLQYEAAIARVAASGDLMQWHTPFRHSVEVFAQTQTISDDTPAIVHCTPSEDPESPTQPSEDEPATTYGGTTIAFEDATCGQSTEVRVSGKRQTCCTGLRSQRAQPKHPTRPREKVGVLAIVAGSALW